MPRHNAKARRQPNERKIKWGLWRQITKDQIGSLAGYLCRYCGRKTKRNGHDEDPLQFTLDHMTPLSRGGRWNRANLACCCRECNNRKGDMTAAEFIMSRRSRLG